MPGVAWRSPNSTPEVQRTEGKQKKNQRQHHVREKKQGEEKGKKQQKEKGKQNQVHKRPESTNEMQLVRPFTRNPATKKQVEYPLIIKAHKPPHHGKVAIPGGVAVDGLVACQQFGPGCCRLLLELG